MRSISWEFVQCDVCYKKCSLGFPLALVRPAFYTLSSQGSTWPAGGRLTSHEEMALVAVVICAIGSINSLYFHIIGDGKLNPSP